MIFTKLRFPDFPWKVLLAESLLIVLSVLLALALDSWREAREHRELADRVLQGFIDEARANCARIQAITDYHQAVINREREPQGVQVGLLRNDAWEVVKITGAAAWLDYDVVALMSEISARQRDHRAVVQAYLGAMFSLILDEEEVSSWHRSGERGVINELGRLQSDLLTGYRGLEASLDKLNRGKVEPISICSST